MPGGQLTNVSELLDVIDGFYSQQAPHKQLYLLLFLRRRLKNVPSMKSPTTSQCAPYRHSLRDS